MYKTVRHGENSLQYTILPQTEEVLSNSGLKGKGRDYSPSIHVRRSRKSHCSSGKCTLFFVFSLIVVIAIVSIPLFLRGARSKQKQLILQELTSVNAPHTPTGRDIVKSRKKELKTLPEISTLQSNLETSSTTILPTTTTTVRLTTVTPPWTRPALKPWKTVTASSTVKLIPTEDGDSSQSGSSDGSVPLLDHYMSVRPWEKDVIIRPTVTPETITFRKVFRYDPVPPITSEKSVTAKVFDDVLISSKPLRSTTASYATTSDNQSFKDLKDAMLSADDDDDFKESLEVDEVFSLPPLKPDSDFKSYGDEVTVSKTAGDWYDSRWPFVDNSAYFPWRHYSDNQLLLPLLLATTGTAITMLILMLIVRRFKRTRSRTAIGDANKSSTPLSQVDDNTNLLANVEDPEE